MASTVCWIVSSELSITTHPCSAVFSAVKSLCLRHLFLIPNIIDKYTVVQPWDSTRFPAQKRVSFKAHLFIEETRHPWKTFKPSEMVRSERHSRGGHLKWKENRLL